MAPRMLWLELGTVCQLACRHCSNNSRALEMGIPIRVGLVEVLAGQRVAQASVMLTRMGVRKIRTDQVRPFGRAAGDEEGHATAGLCGRCGRASAAILGSGQIAPCPMARWLADGDVRTDGLADLLERVWQRAAAQIAPVHAGCGPHDRCSPPCEPQKCDPDIACTP